ncbi:MAG: ABC transporter substrate binding protein [Candidatus Polarisedimenticolia bacterium]
MNRPLGACGALSVVLVLAASPAAAQGRLSGYVTAEDGRALAGVTIEVTGPGAVGVHHAVSDDRGFYELPGLPPHQSLVVKARQEGRVPVVYAGLRAGSGLGTRRDFRLRPPGHHDVLVVLDPRIPYHRIALEGALGTAPRTVSILELSGSRRDDLRLLRETMLNRPNAVLAIGSQAARLTQAEIHDVPIVYTMVMDPATEGLERANVCGTALNDGLDGPLDRLARMKPGATRLLTIYDPRRLSQTVTKLRRQAQARGMTLQALPARDARQAARALDAAGRAAAPFDAFVLLLDPSLIDEGVFERIRRFAAEEKMVFVAPDTSLVAAGATFSYAPGFREMGAYAGRLVNRIVTQGASPAQIGRIFPTTRYFSLNPVEAQRLDLRSSGLP